ncbi:MAG: prenyltransferase/squalene oxidase repeat-containing protein [Bryobacteraceae bacterium]
MPDRVERGLRWLLRSQRSDGGWAPRPEVDQSTWVTALVLLLLADHKYSTQAGRAADWLLAQTGRESGWIQQLRRRLIGLEQDPSNKFSGWPWYPETAAWVVPTSLTILALEKAGRVLKRPDVEARIESGRQFLLARMCGDGGWNHGSSRALGYEAASYPETTGVALLALHGARWPKLNMALSTGERHLRTCRSAEGVSWLRMAMMAHSRTNEPLFANPLTCRTIAECALCLLAEAAAQGRNPLLS